jgi:hypothetical protein
MLFRPCPYVHVINELTELLSHVDPTLFQRKGVTLLRLTLSSDAMEGLIRFEAFLECRPHSVTPLGHSTQVFAILPTELQVGDRSFKQGGERFKASLKVIENFNCQVS